jgi:hypothetical protein
MEPTQSVPEARPHAERGNEDPRLLAQDGN